MKNFDLKNFAQSSANKKKISVLKVFSWFVIFDWSERLVVLNLKKAAEVITNLVSDIKMTLRSLLSETCSHVLFSTSQIPLKIEHLG